MIVVVFIFSRHRSTFQTHLACEIGSWWFLEAPLRVSFWIFWILKREANLAENEFGMWNWELVIFRSPFNKAFISLVLDWKIISCKVPWVRVLESSHFWIFLQGRLPCSISGKLFVSHLNFMQATLWYFKSYNPC